MATLVTLRDAPEPLTTGERRAAWLLAIVVALTRWPARSLTLWDWDEALFASALRDYDVTRHHPHPPGFPLFIGAAKLIPLDAFHALQTVTFLASLLLFPAMFFLGRELRLRPFAAIAASLLLAFFPNVWFFGGTALSDVPSMVLSVTACALLLRGCRSDRALLAGCVLLGIAAGFRPQNLLIGFAPFLIALVHRRRTALIGGVLIAMIVIASFGAAAHFSGGWSAYRDTLQTHQRYIREADSFLGSRHPGLLQVADDFFVRPYRAPLINIVITLLALLGLRRKPWLAIAIFGPFLCFAWLFLDFHSASRFSIAYMPLYAVLAALGIPERFRVATLTAVVALLMVWTWPALRIVHTTASPPVAALQSLHATDVYVDDKLRAHAELLVPHARIVRVTPSMSIPHGAVLVREGASRAPGATNFERERRRLDGIARSRYFEVAVIRKPG